MIINMTRYTVGKITPIQRREVRASDFGPRASFWMYFPKVGSQLTPPHQSEDFKWKDYCPMVFRLVLSYFSLRLVPKHFKQIYQLKLLWNFSKDSNCFLIISIGT